MKKLNIDFNKLLKEGDENFKNVTPESLAEEMLKSSPEETLLQIFLEKIIPYAIYCEVDKYRLQ